MEYDPKLKHVLLKAKQSPVFFAENFLVNPQLQPYKLEPQQKRFLEDKSPFRILFCSRRSGKTLTLIIDLLHKAFFHKSYNLGLVAPTMAQVKAFANVMSDMIARSPMIQSSFIVNNKLDKQLNNLSRITFNTSGAKSGKSEDSGMVGTGYNVLYLDEIQSMDKASLGTLLPVVTGQVGNAQLCFAGTPRSRIGFFPELLKNAKQITEVYENQGQPRPCPKGKNGKYSLHRFQITDLDENGNVAYSRAEYRLSISELETIKDTIGSEMFKREYCLDFIDSISMPFYTDLIESVKTAIPATSTNFGSLAPACAGIDFGKRRNLSALTVATQDRQGIWEAKYYKRWELGTTYTSILHYLNNILPQQFPQLKTLAIDSTGVGEALKEKVNHDSFYNVLGVIFSQPTKVGMVESCVSNMEDQLLRIAPDKRLEKEMSEYRRETTENDRVVFKKGESDDCIDSLMLCNYAIMDYLQNGQKRSKPLLSFSLGANVLNNKNYQNKKRNKYTKTRR